MSALCEDTGLDTRTCGHCLGVTAVDLDSAKVVEVTLELDTSKLEAALARMPRRPAPRPTGKRTRLQQLLETLPDVYATLEDALHGNRTGGEGDRVTGGGGDSRPAPLQLQVAEHRHKGLRGLRWWYARTRTRQHHHGMVVADSPTRLAAALLGRLEHMTDTEQAELQDNLETWRRKARVLTDLPRLRGQLLLGPCPNSGGELWACPGILRAMLPADRDAQAYLTCRECGGRWDVTELPEAANVLLPVHEAAELLGVTVRTVQRRTTRDSGYVRLGDALRV